MKLFLIYLVLINLAGFAAFGIDKYRARHNLWRIRESSLLLLALAGGAIGCLAGMYLFRHKTLHRKFTIGIPVILALELILAGSVFYWYEKHIPYQQNPKKLVSHELSLLQQTDTASVSVLLNYADIFPSATSEAPIPDEILQIFVDFYRSFSYKITNVQTNDNTSTVSVRLNTLDGRQVAREYSRSVLVKQIQNSASPATVEFSLEDCYLLLKNVLDTCTFTSVPSDYTISLTRKDQIWSIDSPTKLALAVTGNFASHVSDADLFSPSEIAEIYLDTIQGFDSEQLSRYLSLDNLFIGDAEYKREISRALARQLLTYLDYSIVSEEITEEGMDADVNITLTSCDCSSMMNQYQQEVIAYTDTAQALQDGISGRLNTANRLLVKAITENTESISTPVTMHMHNDGSGWKPEMNDEMGEALLGNISDAVKEITDKLE